MNGQFPGCLFDGQPARRFQKQGFDHIAFFQHPADFVIERLAQGQDKGQDLIAMAKHLHENVGL